MSCLSPPLPPRRPTSSENKGVRGHRHGKADAPKIHVRYIQTPTDFCFYETKEEFAHLPIFPTNVNVHHKGSNLKVISVLFRATTKMGRRENGLKKHLLHCPFVWLSIKLHPLRRWGGRCRTRWWRRLRRRRR